MNHQDGILDEPKPEPLDLGLKILEEAYKLAGLEVPEWLSYRLPENQLEESIEDNAVIVKRSFEKYVDDQFNRALPLWRSQSEKGQIEIPRDISDRLVKLAKDNLLPDIKVTQGYNVIIRKGILTELYNHSVTKDQCPNLRALADYLGADFKKYNGNKVITADLATLTSYFDKIESDSASG
jgi:hypothetical protein